MNVFLAVKNIHARMIALHLPTRLHSWTATHLELVNYAATSLPQQFWNVLVVKSFSQVVVRFKDLSN